MAQDRLHTFSNGKTEYLRHQLIANPHEKVVIHGRVELYLGNDGKSTMS
jgi:DNA topoisomerase VI subunit B